MVVNLPKAVNRIFISKHSNVNKSTSYINYNKILKLQTLIIHQSNKNFHRDIFRDKYFFPAMQIGFFPTINRIEGVPVLNWHDVEVDKPGEGVLVHGVNVGEVSDREEEDWGVFGDGTVAHTTCVNLLLCLLCNLSKGKIKSIHHFL